TSTGSTGDGDESCLTCIPGRGCISANSALLHVHLQLVLEVDELALVLDLYGGLQAEPEAEVPEELVKLSPGYLLLHPVLPEQSCELRDDDLGLARVRLIRGPEYFVAPVVEDLEEDVSVALDGLRGHRGKRGSYGSPFGPPPQLR